MDADVNKFCAEVREKHAEAFEDVCEDEPCDDGYWLDLGMWFMDGKV